MQIKAGKRAPRNAIVDNTSVRKCRPSGGNLGHQDTVQQMRISNTGHSGNVQ